MNYSPSLTTLAEFGLHFIYSGRGLLNEYYLVYETADLQYKLIWWDGSTGCLDKRLAEPGPPNKNWFNERPTYETLGYTQAKNAIDLRNFLVAHMPAPDLFAQAFNAAFAALHARIESEAYEAAYEGKAKIARLARTGLRWSADVDWLLRRVLKMREQGYIGPEVCTWAIFAAARNSPSDPRGERDTITADVTWHPELSYYNFRANPISGLFRVSDFSTQMRLVAIIDRRPSL